jgi:hypothetical protein
MIVASYLENIELLSGFKENRETFKVMPFHKWFQKVAYPVFPVD